jgi:ubiquinone/menaquinone biosynthesis C-methylase UbiE
MKFKWGEEEQETLKLLSKLDIHGKWVNLACGDGRFMNSLVKRAQVTAFDFDKNELIDLKKNIKGQYTVKIADITEQLPFKEIEFDGAFCTGTFHLFYDKMLDKIFGETKRILKPTSLFVFDFATDLKRTLPSGKELEDTYFGGDKEPNYTAAEAKIVIKQILKKHGFKLKSMIKAKVPKEELKYKGQDYTFNCNFWLVEAKISK